MQFTMHVCKSVEVHESWMLFSSCSPESKYFVAGWARLNTVSVSLTARFAQQTRVKVVCFPSTYPYLRNRIKARQKNKNYNCCQVQLFELLGHICNQCQHFHQGSHVAIWHQSQHVLSYHFICILIAHLFDLLGCSLGEFSKLSWQCSQHICIIFIIDNIIYSTWCCFCHWLLAGEVMSYHSDHKLSKVTTI